MSVEQTVVKGKLSDLIPALRVVTLLWQLECLDQEFLHGFSGGHRCRFIVCDRRSSLHARIIQIERLASLAVHNLSGVAFHKQAIARSLCLRKFQWLLKRKAIVRVIGTWIFC
jgi:hypothetical protein